MGWLVAVLEHIILFIGQPVFAISPYSAVCLAGEA
jgi:hypothetical protein